MPRKTYKKKMPTRRRKPKVIVVKPRIPLNGVQNTEIVKLRYCETITLNNTLTERYSYRANSLYDPNLTGVGHQPMGFDQLAAKYNHYLVLGSRIKITHICRATASTGGDAPSIVTVSLKDNDTTDYGTYEGELESKPFGKLKKMICSDYSPWIQTPDRTSYKVLTEYYDPKKMFGLTRATLNAQDSLKALVNSNPSEDAIYNIMAYTIGASKDPVTLMVEIDYTAKFSEPKNLAQS